MRARAYVSLSCVHLRVCASLYQSSYRPSYLIVCLLLWFVYCCVFFLLFFFGGGVGGGGVRGCTSGGVYVPCIYTHSR